jgi:PEGA domain-containing protein
MNIRYLGLLICLIISTVASGCASIVTGNKQDVSFQSQPDGATVMLDDRAIGKTPVTVTIKKDGGQMIKFDKPGFKQKEMRLETGLNPWFFGNVIFGGLFGSTTDGLSGAVLEYKPNHYFVILEPENNNQLPNSTTNRMKAKEYIIMAYLNIKQDMAKGSGEYLDSLLSLLSVPKEQTDVALRNLRSLSELYENNVPIFADHVIEFYNVK